LRILVVSDAFWPYHIGGITKSLLTEVEGFVARGHQVVVVSRRLRKDLPFHEVRKGYEIYYYDSPDENGIFYRIYPFFSIIKLPNLVSKLQDSDFDVIYVHNPFQMIGLQRVCFGTPIIYVFHAPTPVEIEIDAQRGKYGFFSFGLRFINLFIKMIEHRALRQATLVLVRSNFMKEEIKRLYIDVDYSKLFVIPLAIDTTHFNFISNPKRGRKNLGLPEDRWILLTVRRLVARMGLENLINAMKLVKKEHSQALLLIGGKGYLENTLRELIRSHGLEQSVRLLGLIPEEKLASYYQAADLFVLPTRELEGFGLVTLEALSCGTPVIATPVGANLEVVGPLGGEFLCKDTTPEALAERISYWLSRGISAEVRQACRDYCVSRFAVESVIADLENLFIEAIKRKGNKC